MLDLKASWDAFLRILYEQPSYISALTDIISIVLFVTSIVFAVWQIHRSRIDQREATSRSIFNDYLVRAIQNPVFAYLPRYSGKFDFAKRQVNGKEEQFERYEWFVSYVIFASREILEIHYRNRYWRKAIRRQLKYHKEYIKYRKHQEIKDDFIDLAGKRVSAIMDDILREP